MESPAKPLKDGVVAILQDEQGRYLVIQRGLKLKRAPGWWCFAGGEVEPGEAPAAAVEREVLEEVGLRVQSVAQVHESLSYNGEYTLHWMRVAPRGTLAPLRLDPHEIAAARWLAAPEILKLEPLLPTLREWIVAVPRA